MQRHCPSWSIGSHVFYGLGHRGLETRVGVMAGWHQEPFPGMEILGGNHGSPWQLDLWGLLEMSKIQRG